MASCLTHFSHPRHQLFLSNNNPFTCDFCCTAGTGYRYRCNTCDFHIHESCAAYPQTISFFAHPWHTLSLHPGERENPRVCDLCSEPLRGLFYRCVPCGFDLHPHCSKTPQSVRTELHCEHSLTLLPGTGTCNACKSYCGVWVYKCGICNVKVHIDCLYGPRTTSAKGNERDCLYGPTTATAEGNGRNEGSHHSRLSRYAREFGIELAADATIEAVENALSFLLN